MIKKVLKYIKITPLICVLSLPVVAAEGYYEMNTSKYDFSTMNDEFGVNSLMNAVMENDIRAASIFISAGADVNHRNKAKCTALHFAARKGNPEMVQLLLSNRAVVNVKDKDKWTPLMRASLSKSPEVVQILVDNGAPIWSTNKWGESALMHAAVSDCTACGGVILTKAVERDIPQKLAKEQASKSLEIVKRRYNRDFQELLENFDIYIDGGQQGFLGDTRDSELTEIKKPFEQVEKEEVVSEEAAEEKRSFINGIIYIFTGQKVSQKQDYKKKKPAKKSVIKPKKRPKKITPAPKTQEKKEMPVEKKVIEEKPVAKEKASEETAPAVPNKEDEKIDVKKEPVAIDMEKAEPETTKETPKEINLNGKPSAEEKKPEIKKEEEAEEVVEKMKKEAPTKEESVPEGLFPDVKEEGMEEIPETENEVKYNFIGESKKKSARKKSSKFNFLGRRRKEPKKKLVYKILEKEEEAPTPIEPRAIRLKQKIKTQQGYDFGKIVPREKGVPLN